MKKLLEKISRKLNLTLNEIYTFLFVLFLFLVGIITRHVKINLLSIPRTEYSYHFHDSLLKAIKGKDLETGKARKKNEKLVDSKVELSDFSNREIVSKKIEKSELKQISVNINTADKKILIELPGIGEKTALRIIEKRSEKGRFKNIIELLEVKGIGKKKLESIKKFIYIE